MLLGCGCGGVLELIFVALAGGATSGGALVAFRAFFGRLLRRGS